MSIDQQEFEGDGGFLVSPEFVEPLKEVVKRWEANRKIWEKLTSEGKITLGTDYVTEDEEIIMDEKISAAVAVVDLAIIEQWLDLPEGVHLVQVAQVSPIMGSRPEKALLYLVDDNHTFLPEHHIAEMAPIAFLKYETDADTSIPCLVGIVVGKTEIKIRQGEYIDIVEAEVEVDTVRPPINVDIAPQL